MTERLYYTNSYLRQFEAKVSVRGDDPRRVYLERTAFYPTSGGQPFDTGTIETAGGELLRVVDVIEEGDRIAHVLDRVPPLPLDSGASVKGQIDWARRFDHMQQHSGQHLLSALFYDMLGLATLSVHFGGESSTLDLDTGALALEQIRAVEERANASVWENLPVSAAVQPEGAELPLRKASQRSGPLRVVEIEGLDRSACGGTHVSRTGEIGPIALRKLDRVRKSVRVEFLCGLRATRRARADYELVSDLSASLGTSITGLPETVAARMRDLSENSAELRSAREQLDEYRARELHQSASELPGRPGTRFTRLQQPDGSVQELRGLAQRYAALPGGLLVATVQTPPSLLIAAAESSGMDARALLQQALAKSAGRGGGSPRLAQGTSNDWPSLEAAVEELCGQLARNPETAHGS